MALASCPEPARLQDLLDGSQPADQQEALTRHLDTCTACQQALEHVVGGADATPGWAAHLGRTSPDHGPALQRVLEQLEAASPPAAATDPNPGLTLDFLQPPAQPGQLGRLGHYAVLEVLGRGGMGVVFKAFDQVLQRVVALKVMAPQLAVDGTARQRFVREARAWAHS